MEETLSYLLDALQSFQKYLSCRPDKKSRETPNISGIYRLYIFAYTKTEKEYLGCQEKYRY